MDISSFRSTREVLLSSKEFTRVKVLEDAWLAEFPGNLELLHMASWTSKALGDASRAAEAQKQMKIAHMRHTNLARLRIIALVETICANIVGPQEAGHASEVARRLLDPVGLDEVWGWYQLYPLLATANNMVEIQGFGRYKIQNPNAVIEKRLARGLPWEAEIVSLAVSLMICGRRDSTETIVDVGANIGATGIALASNLPNPVLAIEPEPLNYKQLEENSKLNNLGNLRLRRLALGSDTGQGRVVRGPASNPGLSFLLSGRSEMSSVEQFGSECDVSTLDVEMAETKVAMIKIDVEGGEIEVLKGGMAVIARDHPLIFIELLSENSKDDADLLLGQINYLSVPIGNRNYLYY